MTPPPYLTPLARAALSAAAAERTTAILSTTASKRTNGIVRRILDDLWSGIIDGKYVDAKTLGKEIERLPEARATNPERRSYYAMEALEAVAVAAAELAPDGPMVEVLDDVTPGIWSAYDGLQRRLDGAPPRIINPRYPPPPGPFEEQEDRRLAEDRKILAAGDPRLVAGQLRNRSLDEARRLEPEVRRLLVQLR